MGTVIASGFPHVKDGDEPGGVRVCVCNDGKPTPHVVRRVRPDDAVHVNFEEFGVQLDLVGPWTQCLVCGAWKGYA